MHLMVKRYPDTSEDEWKAITTFRRSTIQLYLQHVEPRHSWQSLIRSVIKSKPVYCHDDAVFSFLWLDKYNGIQQDVGSKREVYLMTEKSHR